MSTTLPRRDYLLSPTLDILFVGGLSIIFFTIFAIFIPVNQGSGKLGWIMFYLSFLVNYPHFLISYQFMYIDNAGKILGDWRLFLAGIAAPVAMILVFINGISANDPKTLGLLANAMYFFVGQHYVKQIMGCVTVTSALKGFYFGKWERHCLFINMMGMWMLSFLGANTGKAVTHNFYGINYTTMGLPRILLSLSILVICITFAILLVQMVRRYIKDGKLPPFVSIVAFASIYVWYIPVFYHPSFFLMIPFFHSLQYYPFAFAYVGNRQSFFAKKLKAGERRKRLVTRGGGYILASFITGGLFFYFIPAHLDKIVSYNKELFGPQIFMFAFTIFLNIHHYFIDFAIWRKTNDNVRKHLLLMPS